MDPIGSWKFPEKKFTYEKYVLIKSTNAFGNTYFSNYIEWQGEARERFFFTHPSAEDFLKANKSILMVTHSLGHQFINNTYLGDYLKIEVTSRNIMKYSFVLDFNFIDAKKNKPVGKGWQKIGFYDEKVQGLCPIPKIFLDLLLPVNR